jgi:hypothetical protein
LLPQAERRLQDPLEMRVAHADGRHVVERIADVLDARPAYADALRDEPRTPVQIELAHVRRMFRVGKEGEGTRHVAAGQRRGDQPRLVDAARHLPAP